MATASKVKTSSSAKYLARLHALYNDSVKKELLSELSLSNINEVPRLNKIVINSGLGKAKDDKHLLETASNTLRKISGQQPVQTVAKKSIATFKLREGSKIGLKVTLRGERMYEFADRLINIDDQTSTTLIYASTVGRKVDTLLIV